MNYQTANAMLTGRCKERRKIGNNTYLIRRGKEIAIRLHQTDIITLTDENEIIVNTGGWHTVTTKARLNEYLPIGIYQKSGEWFWHHGDKFRDGDKITLEGRIK